VQLALGPGESEPQTVQKTMAQLQIGDKVQVEITPQRHLQALSVCPVCSCLDGAS